MSIIGIAAEYNPFHLGHEHHIAQTRALAGEDSTIIGAMSGDFVQRGEAALYSKFARAEAACRCGADLVVELPLPWSLSSAEGFARGAVALLTAAGADTMSFGSEAGEIAPLEKLAELLISPATVERTKEILSKDANLSYAAARQRAVEETAGEAAKLLETPNNILAVEYIKAIYTLNLNMKPMTLKREGSDHDAPGGGDIKSAAEIRRIIANGGDASVNLPQAAAAVFAHERRCGRELDYERMELALLSRLRMLKEADFAAIPDAANGAGARLFAAVRSEGSLNAVLAAAKTKRYALSRIRRMCMCAALGVTAELAASTPPYIRVLAANERGRAQLRALADTAPIPVVTKPASVKGLSAECRNVFVTGAYAHDLYTLAYRAEGERKAGEDWRTGPQIVKYPQKDLKHF